MNQIKLVMWLVMGVFALLLQACGGGGASPTAPPVGGTPATAQVASVQFLVASPEVSSSGSSTVDLTVFALSAGSIGLADKAVSFQVTDPSSTAFLTDVSNGGRTDANGRLTARLNVGSSKANRPIAISATADAATATNAVTVVGTKINVSGVNSLTFGNSTVLTLSLKDSAGLAIPGATVTVASSLGNSLSGSTVVTDNSGQAMLTVTGSTVGNDTIAVTALGTSANYAINVVGTNFRFTAPGQNASVLVNTNQPVTIVWDDGGVPQSGRTINFSTTRGTATPSSVVSDASGSASAIVVSTTTGPATITASVSGGPSVSRDVLFITNNANSINVQSNKTTVEVNAAGSMTNRATITTVVRDINNNPVSGARVEFTLDPGAGGDTFSSPSSVTDIFGIATTDYIPGTLSSAQNGVTIKTRVVDVNGVAVGSPVLGQVQLTVGGQNLFIRLGTDNTVEPSGINYIKHYNALVTDSAGNPRAGVNVQFILKPITYRKGNYSFNSMATPASWTANIIATCANEDQNFNGVLDSSLGEDFNGNGQLDPGNVASALTNIATDAAGFATTDITYAKDKATWTEVSLEARVQVAGTESVSVVNFTLPVAAADLTNASVAPPGQPSPYGVSNCGNPN